MRHKLLLYGLSAAVAGTIIGACQREWIGRRTAPTRHAYFPETQWVWCPILPGRMYRRPLTLH